MKIAQQWFHPYVIYIAIWEGQNFTIKENDQLYLVVGGSVVKFAEGSADSNFVWRGKKFYTPRPINPAVAKVQCDSYSPNPTMKLYADGVLKHTQSVTNSNTFKCCNFNNFVWFNNVYV